MPIPSTGSHPKFAPIEPSSDDHLAVWEGPDRPDANGVIGTWYYHRARPSGQLVTAHRPGIADEIGDGGGGPYATVDAAAEAAVTANPDLPRPEQHG